MTTSLKTILASYSEQFTDADRRLAHELLANPAEAAFLSASELSRRAQVHQASAVRFAQKLGFSGYPELRATLQGDLLEASEPAERVRKRIQGLEGGEVLHDFVQSEVNALLELPLHLTQEQLNAAAKLLIGSRRIYLFARGHATSLADFVDRRLRRSGFGTVLLQAEGRDLAERALSMDQGDALVAFSFHRTPPGLLQLLEHAQEVGAASLLISDLMGHTLHPKPDLLLAAPRGEEEVFQTLSVPMAICNALVLTIAGLDEGRSLEALKKLSELIDRFSQDTGDNG